MRKPVALAFIKTVHAAAFLVIAASGQVVFWDGVRNRPSRRTGVAAVIVLAESAVFAANGFVCPLTPMAERLGAKRGSVSDIFLPDVVARNLTWITGLLLVAGLALNARALWRGRTQLGADWPIIAGRTALQSTGPQGRRSNRKRGSAT